MSQQFPNWPLELTSDGQDNYHAWSDYHANRVLDFHGDPARAHLSVLSDGNHHMALQECLQAFSDQYDEDVEIFYVTLPPNVLKPVIEAGGVQLNNLRLSISPNVIIGPKPFLSLYHHENKVDEPRVFASSLGNSLILHKDIDVAIKSVSELFTKKLRIFISHPERETASFKVYWDSLQSMVKAEGASQSDIDRWFDLDSDHWVIGEYVHHREAPQALLDRRADCSLVYHHLALRYSRIFPETIELVPVHASGTNQADGLQVCTEYYIASWHMASQYATQFKQFMCSTQAGLIYATHGLGSR